MGDDTATGSWTLDPDTRTAMRLDRVRAAMRAQEWEVAVVEVEELLDEEPQHPEALFLLGESLLELGDAALAREVYEDHVRITGGTEPQALVGLALARFETCDLPGAAQAAREAVRLAPDSAEAHFTLGLALERLPRRSVEAATSLSAAHHLDPEAFPYPLDLRGTDWELAVEEALHALHPTLRAFWSGVPFRLERLPDLAELRQHDPPLPPTVPALYDGDLPDGADPHAHRPEALRLFTGNLSRVSEWEDVVDQLVFALQQEALDWLGMTTEDL